MHTGVIGFSPRGAMTWVRADTGLGAVVEQQGTIDIEFDDFSSANGIITVKGLTKISSLQGEVLFEVDPRIMLSGIRSLVDSAVAAGAKRIKFRLDGDVEIRWSGPRSKYHGKLSITRGDMFNGFIDLDGSWDTIRARPEVVQIVRDFDADPRKAAKLSAARTGSWCFCGRFLENDGSIEAGYGPVCASKFGLPWQDHAVGSIELTDDEKFSLSA